MSKQFLAICLAAAVSTAVLAQTVDYGVTTGYRHVSVDGNEQVYRTQQESDSGLVVQDLWLNASDTEGKIALFDHLRLDASGFGADSFGRLRLEMAAAERYSLDLNYRRLGQYNALPGYADPLDAGIGQHTYDRTRQMLDLDLVLRPGKMLQPLVGLQLTDNEGPSLTTFTAGGDDFQLASDLDETERAYYAGLRLVTPNWTGELVAGLRDYSGREDFTLLPGAGNGNSDGTILGSPVTLDDLNRGDRVDIRTPMTRFHITGTPTPRLRLLASYVRADAETDSTSNESLAGRLVSFRLRGLFGARAETAVTQADHPQWRGDLRMVFQATDTLELEARAVKQHRELDGYARLADVFTDVTTFGGAPRADIEEILQGETTWTREDTRLSGRAALRLNSRLGIWADYELLDRESRLTAQDLEIVIPGGQDGTYLRDVDTVSVGAWWRSEKVRAELRLRHEDADRVVVRSDFLDRDTARLKLWGKPFKWLSLQGTVHTADYATDTPDIGYDGSDTWFDLGADLSYKVWNLHLGYGEDDLDNTVRIRQPDTLQYALSIHEEEGSHEDAYLTWAGTKKVHLTAAYTAYDHEGALPFTSTWSHLDLQLTLREHLGLIVQAGRRRYRESQALLSDYEADSYALLVKWSN